MIPKASSTLLVFSLMETVFSLPDNFSQKIFYRLIIGSVLKSYLADSLCGP